MESENGNDKNAFEDFIEGIKAINNLPPAPEGSPEAAPQKGEDTDVNLVLSAIRQWVEYMKQSEVLPEDFEVDGDFIQFAVRVWKNASVNVHPPMHVYIDALLYLAYSLANNAVGDPNEVYEFGDREIVAARTCFAVGFAMCHIMRLNMSQGG